MHPGLYIGDDIENKRCVFLTERLRNAHMHVIGRSDTGKTTHLLNMIRKDIINGRGLCVIDMLGNLYPRLVAFMAYHDLADRVHLFDPSDTEYAPGLNYLDTFDGTLDPASVVETAMEGIVRVYKEQNESAKPRWETYAPLALTPLVKSGLTLLELFPFVSPDLDSFRKKILAEHQEFFLTHGWQEYDSKTNSSKKFELIEVVYNRGMRFWPNEQVRRIVGQTRNFVNWRTAMDEGKVVLCNLGTTGTLNEKQTQMLGVMLLHQIVNAAKTRRGKDLKRFYLYVDEFPQLLCKDFETAPDILRNFGVSLILAHQRLDQLKKELQDINVGSAVMANARIKQVFNISQDDSEIMAKEVFGQFIHGDEVKYQGERTMLVPRQEIIELKASARQSSSGGSSGDGGRSYNEGIVFDIDEFGSSRHSSGSSWHSPSSSNFDQSGESDSKHEALRTSYDREKESETPVYRSIEEKTWEYMRKILGQRQRESILYLPGLQPVTMRTPTISDYSIDEQEIKHFVRQVHKQNGTKTTQNADLLIEERYRKLLGSDFNKLWNSNVPTTVHENVGLDEERWQ